MRYRKLRIAWSVFWGVAAVLLVVLWVRSYSGFERVNWNLDGNHELSIGHDCGDVRISKRQLMPPPMRPGLMSEPEKWSPLVNLPYWFLVGLSCFSTASPWLPWRFSLRTLLIATTLVAVLLGTVIWAVR